jgi:hypothetical protein
VQKRINQRRAALELDPSPIEVNQSKLSSVSSPMRRQKLPVLEPSVFRLDTFDAAEWIIVLKTGPVHWLNQKKTEPAPLPVC